MFTEQRYTDTYINIGNEKRCVTGRVTYWTGYFGCCEVGKLVTHSGHCDGSDARLMMDENRLAPCKQNRN